jgi:hypothetical protein
MGAGVAAVTGRETSGGTGAEGAGRISEVDSSGWGPNVVPELSAALATSATVSVTVVNKLGASVQPTGRAKGNPTRYSLPSAKGKITPSFGTSEALTQIR